MSYYKILNRQLFSFREYSLVPIRYEDRFDIMKWRNEQIYHLRQREPLTPKEQDRYFNTVIANLFEETTPNQLLFSYLRGGVCIGYGGLVHINWIDKNAEISFIMDTLLEKNEFHKHWCIYLNLLDQIAFEELHLHKIYTYAFNLRPHLYEVLEKTGFTKEAILEEHCLFRKKYIDVVIHSKINHIIHLRRLTRGDEEITYQWANDELNRKNSFNSSPIGFEEHLTWFTRKISDSNAIYYICEINNSPAGLIRFDINNDKVIIGITIDKKFRGKKLSSRILHKSCEEISNFVDLPIIAYIKKENIASVKSFEKAGFNFVKNITIQNIDTYEYIYRK